MHYPWGHKRRFNAYSEYFKRTFGERVQKISVDAGFTCPNRDGAVGTGGCSYCNNDAFNPSYCRPDRSVTDQIREGIEFHRKRYRRASKYLVYFQAFSNTYAPLQKLKKLYSEALSFPEIVGLVIGTRPDCIDDEKIAYFRELNRSFFVVLEYGVESVYNRTLERINRGHTFEQSVEALEKTASAGIKTGIHLIFGLPGESREEMMYSANVIAQLPVNSVKFHQLQIIRGTFMEKEYRKNPDDFGLFTMDEYIWFIIEFIEHLPPEIIIERFAGEVPPRYLAGPSWGPLRNDQILAQIEKELESKNTWQGKFAG
jgi:radical SAM protein (TIGR01212 family)